MGLEYTSVRFIRIRNTRLAILYYSIVAAIVLYILLWTIILNKGYQKSDVLIGGLAFKVKGISLADSGKFFDAMDLVQPATESSALFITSALVETIQTVGDCAGFDKSTETCDAVRKCAPGQRTANGIISNDTCAGGYCFVRAWCPVENDTSPLIISDVLNYTIFVKANLKFPLWGISQTNAPALIPGENLFSLAELLRMSGNTFASVAEKGAILLVSLLYDCNLDRAISNCKPKITVDRIDISGFSPGFNYRFVSKYIEGGVETRTLNKVIGTRLLFQLSGKGRKFDFTTLLLTFGSGVALLGVSTLICDIVMQYVLPEKDVYRKEKYEVIGEDAAMGHISAAGGSLLGGTQADRG